MLEPSIPFLASDSQIPNTWEEWWIRAVCVYTCESARACVVMNLQSMQYSKHHDFTGMQFKTSRIFLGSQHVA